MKLNSVINERYQVVRQIGRGGTSDIYLVKHIYLDSEFAMKAIPIKPNSEIDYSAEAHILKDLRHARLPRIIDIFQDAQYLYIIRDFIDGEDLEKYVDMHGPQTFATTIDYTLQLIDVLSYIHTRPEPLVYRDLKPTNIIRSRDGKLTLIDFGTTRIYKPTNDEDTVYLGTKGYAPPELFGGMQSDQRTDIYSLGATIYYLYSGEHWSEVGQTKKFNKFRGEKAEALKSIIEKAMQLTPERRYQTVSEVKQALVDSGLYRLKDVASTQMTDSVENKVIVGVMGLSRGCGCTHQAIAIAKYCAQNIGKTIYLQRVEQANLKLFDSFISGGAVNNGNSRKSFKAEGVEFLTDVKADAFNTLITRRDTNIVIDYATHTHFLNDFLKAHKKIVVLPKSAWALSDYQTIFELLKYQDVEFIVNLAGNQDLLDIADWLGIDEKRLHAIGYLPNPFMIKDYTDTYRRLIGKYTRKRLFNFWGGNK